MKVRSYLASMMIGSAILMIGSAFAETPASTKPAADAATSAPATAEKPVCGYDLMTEQERTAFHEKMRGLKTQEERERLRKEHHAEMMQRAKERGVTLPPEPMKGCGPNMGMGHGKMKSAGMPKPQN